MLITNQSCHISRYLGADIKSQPIYDDAKQEGCNVITFRLEEVNSSIRADTSGSQGRATIQRAMIRIQLRAETQAVFGSKVKILSQPEHTYKLVEKHPRFDAMGVLHHYQCDLERL
jgi:hypothetical protein